MPTIDGPVRVIGRWGDMDAKAREAATYRGLDKIFDPALRESICELIEDVRQNGDEAVARALKKFDGCDVEPGGLRVTDEELATARAQVSDQLLSAIRDGIDHVRRFNEQLVSRGDWEFESEPGLTVG